MKIRNGFVSNSSSSSFIVSSDVKGGSVVWDKPISMTDLMEYHMSSHLFWWLRDSFTGPMGSWNYAPGIVEFRMTMKTLYVDDSVFGDTFDGSIPGIPKSLSKEIDKLDNEYVLKCVNMDTESKEYATDRFRAFDKIILDGINALMCKFYKKMFKGYKFFCISVSDSDHTGSYDYDEDGCLICSDDDSNDEQRMYDLFDYVTAKFKFAHNQH